MKVLILGADGYLGWPTSMHLASKGFEVVAVDNYSRRSIAGECDSEALIECPMLDKRAEIYKDVSGKGIKVTVGDCADFEFVDALFESERPDAVIHFAEQPSAPYSMKGSKEAVFTLNNNLNTTLNVTLAVIKHVPNCHIVKLGTMGEYGTPNIDIEEGWLDIEHKGRKDRFLFPRQAGSLYHTTKVLDTDLLWFYVRTYGLSVTDLMQGPVYGIHTEQSKLHDQLLPNFHYDDIFGTVLNRFIVQAVAGLPLTVYGKGGQTRGYLNLMDTLQCIELAVRNPVEKGKLRVFNQFTESFSVNELASKVQAAGESVGLSVSIESIENPRKELEEHYYNPVSTGLVELGLQPNLLTNEVLVDMINVVKKYKDKIKKEKVMPRVRWK